MGSRGGRPWTVRARFWLEVGCALGAVVGALATILAPNWFELLFDAAPDGGDGTLEQAVPVVLGLVALLCAGLARREWRRASSRLDLG